MPSSSTGFAPFKRQDGRSLCELHCFGPRRDYLILAFLTIGGDAVGIVGIVVVQRTVRVHNAHIVRVVRVGRTQPTVTGLIATTLFSFHICFFVALFPSLQELFNFYNKFRPVLDLTARYITREIYVFHKVQQSLKMRVSLYLLA